VEAARAAAVEPFGFDMPETITVEVSQGSPVRLFNDGQDHFSLTVRSEADLQQPSKSGVFHLYGMSHEVGHLAMYRLIHDHSWMTVAAAEGWAHYLGSRLLDAVYEREGEKLWPDAYDYRADGMARLQAQVASGRRGEVNQGAALWMELAGIVGDAGVAPVFRAWGQASVDPADPGASLRKALLATNNDARLADWWNKAEPLFVFKRPKSGFAARTVEKGTLMRAPRELAQDDGKTAGQSSIAGGGHAVRFEVPGDTWYLTAVRIYGSRYGYPAPPAEDFHVWLCDADLKVIADFPFPYAKFARGNPSWVKLDTTPTNVPAKFIICVGFNPTATKGVYVHHDAGGSGNSLVGLPGGKAGRTFSDGDWMVRAVVDEPKAADPLRMPK
jgi:RNA polymerase sigma-70 factor (ECF subfamily)